MDVKFFNGSVFVQQIRNDFQFSAQPYRDYEHITTAEKLNKAPEKWGRSVLWHFQQETITGATTK